MILIANPTASRHQPATQPATASAGQRPIPARQAGHGRTEHRGIGLKGAAVSHRERKNRKDKNRQKRHPRAFAPPRQLVKSPTPPAPSTGPRQSARPQPSPAQSTGLKTTTSDW